MLPSQVGVIRKQACLLPACLPAAEEVSLARVRAMYVCCKLLKLKQTRHVPMKVVTTRVLGTNHPHSEAGSGCLRRQNFGIFTCFLYVAVLEAPRTADVLSVT